MSALSNEEYAKKVLEVCKDAKPELPFAYHDPDGDCIEVLVGADPFYSERIDDLVTVYYSETNREIIGCLIKGVKRILDNDPKTQIIVHAGRIRLSDFFLLGFLTQKSADLRMYQKLRECVEQYHMEAELCGHR